MVDTTLRWKLKMEEHEPQLEKVDLVITDTPAFQILKSSIFNVNKCAVRKLLV
jgi:hypothetical protein